VSFQPQPFFFSFPDWPQARPANTFFSSRGKKVFRKFAEPEQTGEEQEDGEAANSTEANLGRPLTRSGLKPRLLFPPQPKKIDAAALEEEEAVTDVEEDIEVCPETPTKAAIEAPNTPNAPRFGAAMSPPDSKRATRAGDKKDDDATPIKVPGRRSPFDSWPRVKDRSAAPSHKRHGEALASSNTKRPKA
jgi:hypothetical protein